MHYCWSVKGKQPRIEQKQRGKERQTIFGCVNYLTGQVSAKRADHGNANTFLDFLKKVIRDNDGKKVIMVLDNVRYHHAKRLNKFLTNHKEKIELLFLPPYSPDFNPMERIWWFMRKKITHCRAINTLKQRIVAFWKLFSQFKQPNERCLNLCNLCVF